MAMNEGKLPCNSNTEEDMKALFERESKSFLEELEELTKEFGVEACAIVCSPFGGDKPTLWPSSDGVIDVLSKSLNPLNEMISELELEMEVFREQMKKEKTEKREKKRRKKELRKIKEMRKTMIDCLTGKRDLRGMSSTDLKDLYMLGERYMNDITNQLSALGLKASASADSAADAGNGEQQDPDGDEAEKNEAATENNGDQIPSGSNQHVEN